MQLNLAGTHFNLRVSRTTEYCNILPLQNTVKIICYIIITHWTRYINGSRNSQFGLWGNIWCVCYC